MDFRELHDWIDTPWKKLGKEHRLERHTLNSADKEKIHDYWEKKGKGLGDKAVVEWLFHIALDNLDTAFKISKPVYGEKTYNFFEFGLSGSGFIHADFDTFEEDELEDEFGEGYEDEEELFDLF